MFHEYCIVLGHMPLPLTGKDKVLWISVPKRHQKTRLCEANLNTGHRHERHVMRKE